MIFYITFILALVIIALVVVSIYGSKVELSKKYMVIVDNELGYSVQYFSVYDTAHTHAMCNLSTKTRVYILMKENSEYEILNIFNKEE